MTQILTALLGCLAVTLPGLLFSLALFPGRNQMDLPTRIVSGVGLGLLLSTWVSYILARYHRLVLGQFLAAMAVAGAVLFLLAYIRGGIKIPSFLQKKKTPSEMPAGEGSEGGVQVQAGDSGQS